MNDYISREVALKKLQMQLLDLEADQDKGEYSELCKNRGARDALDGAINDIRAIKGEDVQPAKQWISVKDRLPDNCVEVLVYDTDCGIVIGWYDKEISDFAADFISPLDAVTHWQPLPKPPKDGDVNG